MYLSVDCWITVQKALIMSIDCWLSSICLLTSSSKLWRLCSSLARFVFTIVYIFVMLSLLVATHMNSKHLQLWLCSLYHTFWTLHVFDCISFRHGSLTVLSNNALCSLPTFHKSCNYLAFCIINMPLHLAHCSA